MPQQAYLRRIKEAASREGYKNVKLATDGIHKIVVYDEAGKAHYAGRKGYNDFHIYTLLEKKGDVAPGTAEAKRKAYRARATNIRGKWKDDKYSPNNLAIRLLW